jgi:uncharacterized protein
MGDEVLERLVAGYMATNQPQYAFGWQGGEPTLMGVDFFRRVTSLQQKYGRNGVHVANGLQTNGTLLDDDLARHLARFHFLLGVSLDGPESVHDRFRRSFGGAGSHAQVLRGIGVLRRHGVEFNILTLVSRANVDRPSEIYRYLCDQGFLFHQYIECVEFDPQGGLLPFAISGAQWGDFLCGIFDEWVKTDTRRVSVRLFDTVIQKMVEGTAGTCQAEADCRQYFVVEFNGDVYPCDFFVERDLCLGNVTTGSWQEFGDSPVYREFGRRKSTWNEACTACEYLRFCAGDCPKNRFRTGVDPRQLSELCRGWKQFYRHSLDTFRQLADGVIRERLRAEKAQKPRPVRPAGAAGRNDPCPCGSGRKAKKCCLVQ